MRKKQKKNESFVMRFMGLDIILRASDWPKEVPQARINKRLKLATQELSQALCMLYGVGTIKS